MPTLPIRPRRLRQSESIRRLVREHRVLPERVLVEISPAEPAPAGQGMEAFGGAWWTVSGDPDAAEEAVKAARAAFGDGCLAVDIRQCGPERVEAAMRLRAAGADLIALDGKDTAAVRDAFEAAGDVHALIAACASFPLDGGPEATAEDWDGAEWVQAGADFIVIEPALPNLDRIRAASESLPVPVIARCTPQEIAAYAASFERGWLDPEKIPAEVLTSICRAGARAAVVPGDWALAITGAKA